ncbi:MAG: hypothetical protein A2201_04335 [Alicyclobacillus sp. RIFOXYA1_FULL_53_8]|nr:MAG: hypothetical protein A2201_04335 [Alicyclobacillus sp. RIFOXYA1_FULL_53_8]
MNQIVNQINILSDLAEHVEALEMRGKSLSEDWYQFKAGQPADVQELFDVSVQSLNLLGQLAQALSERLSGGSPTDPERSKLQYAYNLTQELIQSREANLELLNHILQGNSLQEYLRALSLKENAAAKQAMTLRETIHAVIQ